MHETKTAEQENCVQMKQSVHSKTTDVKLQKSELTKSLNESKHKGKVGNQISRRTRVYRFSCSTTRYRRSKVISKLTMKMKGKRIKDNSINKHGHENEKEVPKKGMKTRSKSIKGNCVSLEKENIEKKNNKTSQKKESGRSLKDPTKTWLEQMEEEERSDNDDEKYKLRNDLLNQYYQGNTSSSKKKTSVDFKAEMTKELNNKSSNDSTFRYNTRQRKTTAAATVTKTSEGNHKDDMEFDTDQFFPDDVDSNRISQEDIK